MKKGDKVFVYTREDVHQYCKIEEITKDSIELTVINGAYALHIAKVAIPEEVSGDYNKAIDWFRKRIGRHNEKRS